MKKLRLFFMMAAAVLFTGWAFADNEAGDPTTGQDVEVIAEPTFPITLTIGLGQDDPTTGISQNAFAYWDDGMGGEGFFDTPRDLHYVYQLMTDGNPNRPATEEGEPNDETTQVFHKATDPNPITWSQFVMDPLVPNRLYKVMVYVEGDNEGEVYASDWYYFISAIPELVPGKLVWNWGAYEELKDEDDYPFSENLVEDNGGVLRFKFSNFADNESGVDADGNMTYVHVDGVRGYVELYVNGQKRNTYNGTSDVQNNTAFNAISLVPKSEYELKAYATYKYKPGEIIELPEGVYVKRSAEVEAGPYEAEGRGPAVWQGTSISPSNIHVGQYPHTGTPTGTLVVLENLPMTSPNYAIGILRYRKVGDTEWSEVAVNRWYGSQMADWVVPLTEDFEFSIQVTAILNDNTPFYFGMPEDHPTGTVTFGNAKEFTLTDRTLLWAGGLPTYTIPLKADEVADARRTDFIMTYRVKGDRRSQQLRGYVRAIGGTEEEPEYGVVFTFPTTNTSVAQDKEFDIMTVTVSGGRSFINSLKQEWKFFTSEGAYMFAETNTGSSYIRFCDNNVFDGSVNVIDPRNDDAPLKDVNDPTKDAPRYFFDWAWTPNNTPAFKDIQIEHNDEVTFITTNADRTEDETLTYTSKVTYKRIPKAYNNAQAITKLTMKEYNNAKRVPKEEVFTFERKLTAADLDATTWEFEDGGWGAQIYAWDENFYGPMEMMCEIVGEVPEGNTTKMERSFTIAPREGKIQNGSEGVDGFALDSPVPEYVLTTTLVNGVLSLVPEFVVNNIYNWNYIAPATPEATTTTTAHVGDCDFTIYAWLETPSGEIAKSAHGQKFLETSSTGHINELGEVVLDNKIYFVDVEYSTSYKLKGYMLYTPQRYGLMGHIGTYTLSGNAPVPTVGPVVKVPFELGIKTGSEIPGEAPEDSNIEYWIAEEDYDGNAGEFVEVRIYDPEELAGEPGTAGENELKLICQLIPNSSMPAVADVKNKWVPSTDEDFGYYSFLFPVDNDETTDDVRRTYRYGFSYYYQQGALSTQADFATGDFGINTPDPYREFTKHAPESVSSVEGFEATTEVGPWTLKEYSESLTNFFAFTEGYLPSEFKNWEEYWGNPDIAWNLVYGYKEMELIAPLAPAMRAAEVNRGVKNNYAPTVKLADAKNADGVRYEYFNDEEFVAGTATYSADYTTYKNLKRSVVVPFDATTDASVYWLSSAKLDDTGSKISFLFSQRKVGGVPFNGVKATIPYVAIAEAKGTVDFVGFAEEGNDITIHTSKEIGYGDVEVRRDGKTVFYAFTQGLYAAKWNQDIVPDPDEEGYEYDWYRYYDGSCLALPKKGEIKDEAAGTYWDASYKDGQTREWKPNFAGVNAFECYFYIWDNGYTSGDFSISFRFEGEDDDDATVIESINVEVESSEMFDLQGRKVLEPVKGQIYIQNGKKILF